MKLIDISILKIFNCQFNLMIGIVLLAHSAFPTLSLAQISSDNTLPTPTEVLSSPDNLNFMIRGGTQLNRNLFHSFSAFSVPENGTASFINSSVDNIISRVTGGSISNINGLIQANGQANIFILNPSGIAFGPNAQLSIGGSFIASTSERINFADGRYFSADSLEPTVLTVSLPSGLQFGENSGNISVQSNMGIQVPQSKTLALIGRDITVDNSRLLAPTGRIELGSIRDNSLVTLQAIPAGWSFGYENIQNFGDITLRQGILDTFDLISFTNSGNIQLFGNHILLTNRSELISITNGNNMGGSILVSASDSLSLNDSVIITGTFSDAVAGNIEIQTKHLSVANGTFIDASSFGVGPSGTLTVNATETIEVAGGSEGFSQLTAQAFSSGDSGNLNIETKRLILRDGGQITSSTLGDGNGGELTIKAFDSINISGSIPFENSVSQSGIFASTSGSGAGGTINVETRALQVFNRGLIDARTIGNGSGGNIFVKSGELTISQGGQILTATEGKQSAGNITLEILENLTIKGNGSGLFANATPNSTGAGGSIIVDPPLVIIRDQAGIGVDSQGTGPGGIIDLQAGTLILDNSSFISASTFVGQGGDIRISVNEVLQLLGNSSITATAGQAGGNGDGGNITIPATLIITNNTGNNDITANAFSGTGGNITINTEGLFGFQTGNILTPFSDITASSNLGLAGSVTIDIPETDPSRGLVQLPETIIDPILVAQSCSEKSGQLTNGASEFVVSGRGGLSTSPDALLSQKTVSTKNWVTQGPSQPDSQARELIKPHTNQTILVEAQGWKTNSSGQLLLTAQPQTPSLLALRPHPSCQQS